MLVHPLLFCSMFKTENQWDFHTWNILEQPAPNHQTICFIMQSLYGFFSSSSKIYIYIINIYISLIEYNINDYVPFFPSIISYFVGIFPYIGLKYRPYIWLVPPIVLGSRTWVSPRRTTASSPLWASPCRCVAFLPVPSRVTRWWHPLGILEIYWKSWWDTGIMMS